MTLTAADISELYKQNATALLRYFVRRTLDVQIAVDLVGETFAIAFEQRTRFRGVGEAQLRSWLFGIGTNLLNDFFRSGQIEQRAMQRLGVPPTQVADDQIERIEQLSASAELREAVADALSSLLPEQRDALQLRVVEDLPYPQVAARMNVSEQVARARVSRGLRKLRDVIDNPTCEEASQHV